MTDLPYKVWWTCHVGIRSEEHVVAAFKDKQDAETWANLCDQKRNYCEIRNTVQHVVRTLTEDEGLPGLLFQFQEAFYEDIERARECGALTGDETEVEIGRMVLQVAAERLRPLAPENKVKLANLKRFI